MAELLLPSPQTTLVVLLGASEFPQAPSFESSEAFVNSAKSLRAYFINIFKLPKENLLDLFNADGSPPDIEKRIGNFLKTRVSELKQSGFVARDIIFYYVGHGGFARSNRYQLLIRSSQEPGPQSSKLEMESLAHTIKENARFLRRILILDCCFSATAVQYQAPMPLIALRQTMQAFEEKDKGRGFPSRGTSLLCSSNRYSPSVTLSGAKYTTFSEALLFVLQNGDVHSRNNLSLYTLAHLMDEFLFKSYQDSVPRPEVHSPDQSEGDIAEIPFFPNIALVDQEVLDANAHINSSESLQLTNEAFLKPIKYIHSYNAIKGWEYVTYENQRDLGAALAGRSLGPSDVESCPQLPEVKTILQQLSVAYNAIIKGRSGCGKTITAFQSAYEMHKQGWKVLRLVEPHLAVDELIGAISNLPQRTVLILDNAQSLDQHLVRRLQEHSGSNLAVIIVLTEEGINPLDHDAVSIVNSRAVDILAKAIRNGEKEILSIIQKLDPHIGEGFFDVPLERRIEEAVQCETPWQFNFVLTGGELRSRDILAKASEMNRADLLLVTIAVGQIVTLDEGVPMSWLERAISFLGRDKQWLEQSFQLLQKQRVVFGKTYYRCSHLRFSVYALRFLVEDTKNLEWSNVVTMLRGIISWESTSLRGISWLLRELRFADTFMYQQKNYSIVTYSNWQQIVERCWIANSGEDRRDAAFVLDTLIDWYPNHIQTISDNILLLAQWIENADKHSGFGLGLLVNSLSQEYRQSKHVILTLMKHIDPHVMASKLPQLKWEGVAAWSFLIGRLYVAFTQEWRVQFNLCLDFTCFNALVDAMSRNDIYAFDLFLNNIGPSHTDKALNLIERAIPQLVNAFHNDFIETFKEFRDAIWFVLGYARGFLRRKRPSSSQHRIAKKIANALQPQIIANAISCAAQRDWGSCADMLSFIKEAAPTQAAKIANLIKFSQLDATAQGLWGSCPHELLQLILSLSILPNHEPARSWITQHSEELKEIHCVLAVVAPQTIVEKLRTGHNLPLTLFNSELSLLALRSIATMDSLLAVRAFKHNVATIAKEISELQPHNCQGVSPLISYLYSLSQDDFIAMIKDVNPVEAKKNWGLCLQGNTESKKTVALIFAYSQLAEGPIAEIISHLKMKYPRASVCCNQCYV
ncbi:hypothetical protein [Ktedonobacter racemifer]|nr:hypothetical protein [Ktedonobacter racemifer]